MCSLGELYVILLAWHYTEFETKDGENDSRSVSSFLRTSSTPSTYHEEVPITPWVGDRRKVLVRPSSIFVGSDPGRCLVSLVLEIHVPGPRRVQLLVTKCTSH